MLYLSGVMHTQKMLKDRKLLRKALTCTESRINELRFSNSVSLSFKTGLTSRGTGYLFLRRSLVMQISSMGPKTET